MKTFWLKVIASDRVAYNGRCQKVIVPAADGGQMGILADHENMVIAIEVGEAKMQLVNNRVTMLVQTAEKPEEIDARRAEERREVMEEKLRQKQSIQEYYHTKASLARAMNRLKVSREKNTRI